MKTTSTKYKRSKGFTLIELLLYMGLSSILLLVISNLFVSVLAIRNEAEQTSVVEREGRYVLSRLSYDIYRAQDIVEPSTLGEQSSSLQLIINGQLFTYSLINDKLYLTDSLGTYQVNSKNSEVATFAVTRKGNVGGRNAVKLNLDITSLVKSAGKVDTRNYQTIMAPR